MQNNKNVNASPSRQRIEEVAQRILDQEILSCQSSLVDALLAHGDLEGWTIDDIENLWGSPPEQSNEPDELPQEIFEWWLVTRWLAEKLRAMGQPVIDNGHGTWWGRTCTGQAILLDGTLQAIAERLLK